MRSNRKCGTCDACCTVLEIPSVPSEGGKPCTHMTGSGTKRCGIYAQRPSECQGFVCHWLAGIGPSSSRPDRSGIMFQPAAGEFDDMVVAHILREGAETTQKGRAALEDMMRRTRAAGMQMLIRRSYMQID
jgi:hypothetical protein